MSVCHPAFVKSLLLSVLDNPRFFQCCEAKSEFQCV